MDNMTIGQRLALCVREDAKKHGITLKEAAERLEMNYNTLFHWEHTDPSAYALQQAAEQGWDVHWILTGRDGWIRVEERLPERTMPPRDVLVYHDLNCGMSIDRAWYDHGPNKWRSVLGMRLKVTHWRPLPKPPKGQEDL